MNSEKKGDHFLKKLYLLILCALLVLALTGCKSASPSILPADPQAEPTPVSMEINGALTVPLA